MVGCDRGGGSVSGRGHVVVRAAVRPAQSLFRVVVVRGWRRTRQRQRQSADNNNKTTPRRRRRGAAAVSTAARPRLRRDQRFVRSGRLTASRPPSLFARAHRPPQEHATTEHPPPVAGPDEPDRVPDAARLAGVEGRAGFGYTGRPVVYRARRDRRQHSRRGRRVQQLQAPVADQHVHRFAGRVRPHGRRGRIAVQCHLGGVQGNHNTIIILLLLLLLSW